MIVIIWNSIILIIFIIMLIKHKIFKLMINSYICELQELQNSLSINTNTNTNKYNIVLNKLYQQLDQQFNDIIWILNELYQIEQYSLIHLEIFNKTLEKIIQIKSTYKKMNKLKLEIELINEYNKLIKF